MISINECKDFRDNQCSLQETSKNDAGGNYMTMCRKKVVNFDKVKRCVMNQFRESEDLAHSVDALVVDTKNYFIEFKDGDAKKEQHEVHLKARDSVLIANYLLNRQIDESRKSDVFVLVYNSEKVKFDYKEILAWKKAQKGRQRFCPFELWKLKGFIFSDVIVVNKEEFEDEFVKALGWS